MQCCCIIFIKNNKHLSHNNCTFSDFMIEVLTIAFLSSMLLSYFVHDFKVLDHFSTIDHVFYVEPACHCQVVVVVISKSEEDVVTGSIKVDARDVCQTEIRVCVCVCIWAERNCGFGSKDGWLFMYGRRSFQKGLFTPPAPLLLIKTILHHFNGSFVCKAH